MRKAEAGLTEEQGGLISEMLYAILDRFSVDDDRPRHFTVLIFTKEGEEGLGDKVSTTTVSSLDGETMEEFIRDWLHRRSQ